MRLLTTARSAAPPLRLLFAALALALVLGFLGTPTAHASAGQAEGSQVLVDDIDRLRANAGVDPLKRTGKMDEVARKWAAHQASSATRQRKPLAHNPHYSSQIPQTGLRGSGENVAYACGRGGVIANAQAIAGGLEGSPGHYNNMVRSTFTHVGVGVAYRSDLDCLYATQVFARYDQEFHDVPRSHQFYSQITWLSNSGITTGYADGTFRPKANVSREAFTAFLYRLAGRPQVTLPSTSPFKDVPTSAQFYTEIVWASQQGITTGWADGTFRPRNSISREAIAAFLYRFHGEPDAATTSATRFRDIDHSSAFLHEISWLESSGITTGFSDGTFRPHARVTREAVAAFLQRSAP